MTLIQGTTTTRKGLLTDFWLRFVERLRHNPQARSAGQDNASQTDLPNSGMPISNDVVTKISIRAGFTAGPW